MRSRGYITAVVLLAGMLTACVPAATENTEAGYFIYYLNEDRNTLEAQAYTPASDGLEACIGELAGMQGRGTQDGRYVSLLPDNVRIRQCLLDGSSLTLDFSESYATMPVGREALVRGGLVREFLQIDGVDRLFFTVNGMPLTDSYGREIGLMTVNSFVENSAETINAYRSVTMTLYFTNADGIKLIPETRKVYYIGSEPLERAVVEELFKGPRMAGSLATFGTDINILSVITQDDTCYVNLDSSSVGTATAPNVAEEVQIYAIVNSLADTCGVSQVQITLDGESNRMFRESVSLSQTFTKEESLIE